MVYLLACRQFRGTSPDLHNSRHTMNFASDNWAGAHPAIASALSDHAAGFAAAYGTSTLDQRIERLFNEVFEREVAVYFVATGTAANALSMTALARPGGVGFAHAEAHMLEDECGAPEYFTGGMRMVGVPGSLGRIDPARLDAAIRRYPEGFVHSGRPVAVSITQATEIGTVYSLDQIDAVADVARRHKLPLHMDGARFANALVRLGCSPAEMTWKRGVDILSFGGTKNGCWCAEAIVVFRPELAADMPFLRKRAAQLFSKTRFVSAQFEAYFAADLWLDSARHANDMAARLADIIEAAPSLRLAWQAEANELFPVMDRATADRLHAAGALFNSWRKPSSHADALRDDEAIYRLVTSFATTADEIQRFAALVGA